MFDLSVTVFQAELQWLDRFIVWLSDQPEGVLPNDGRAIASKFYVGHGGSRNIVRATVVT